MKNITLKIDDETYRKARIRAAEKGTSVSAMVREFLRKQSGEDETHACRVAELEELYRIADARAADRPEEMKPFTREEIHHERLP
jgi:plasmid stability protein